MNVTLSIFYLVHVAWRSECAGTIVYFPSSYLLQFRTMIDWCQEIAWMDTRGQELGQVRSRSGLASTIIRYVLAVLWNLSESISFAQKLCTSPSRVWDELAVLLLVVTLPCFIAFNTGKYTGLLILAYTCRQGMYRLYIRQHRCKRWTVFSYHFNASKCWHIPIIWWRFEYYFALQWCVH